MDLVLASASPRRSDLLASAGLVFEILPSRCPEPAPEANEPAQDYALRMASLKAQDVAELLAQETGAGGRDVVILAADTVVAIGGRILGKPADSREARTMLDLICPTNGLTGGRPVTHQVATGCALLRLERDGNGCVVQPLSSFSVTTEVEMGPVPEAALEAYARSEEPLDKAGAYAIQGQGGFLVRAVHGSYSNVVGLPLAEVLNVLLGFGIIISRKS
jgi:septum formation protein